MHTWYVWVNYYPACLVFLQNGVSHVFDSFECAIHRLAPICAHCQCRIVGHGIQAQAKFYCCAHCARESGISGAVDNVS